MAKKPNVLFILTDDQRFDTINRIYGGQIKTPTFDELTKEGMYFTQASIMGGTNPAVCCPSRNMILTGRSLYETEGNGYTVSENVKTLPQVFKDNGYDSYHVGKWHQDLETHKRSFNRGKAMRIEHKFDPEKVTGTTYMNHFATVAYDYNKEGDYNSSNFNFYGTPFISMAPYQRYSDSIHSSTVFTNAAIDIINEHDSSKPYFMFLAYIAPHDPRQYPTEYHEMYKDMDIKLPENYMAFHPFDNGEMYVRDELLAGFPRLPWCIKEHIRDYYAIISHLDHEIGRIIKLLKEKGEWENTIIVLAGDNGLAVGQHGLMGKQNVYDHSIRVPLLITGPGVPKDKQHNTQCYLYDIFPTLCDMLNMKLPETVSGKSFVQAFSDPEFKLREESYHGYMHLQRALRQDKYKLNLYHVEGNWIVQLFDLEKDPKEINNLASKEEYKNILDSMLKEIRKTSKDYKDNNIYGNNFWNGFDEFIKKGSFSKPKKFSSMGGGHARKKLEEI